VGHFPGRQDCQLLVVQVGVEVGPPLTGGQAKGQQKRLLAWVVILFRWMKG